MVGVQGDSAAHSRCCSGWRVQSRSEMIFGGSSVRTLSLVRLKQKGSTWMAMEVMELGGSVGRWVGRSVGAK